MARIKVHALCRLPLSECPCPDDEDEAQPEEDIPATGGETR